MTLNLGNYESMRVDATAEVTATMPPNLSPDEVEVAKDSMWEKAWTESRESLRKQVEIIRSKVKA